MADRFTRQERLAEVGAAGQARLREGSASVPDGADAALAALFLERAGVREIRHDAGAAPFAHAAAFRHAASRTIGSAAWRAQRELLRLLELLPT